MAIVLSAASAGFSIVLLGYLNRLAADGVAGGVAQALPVGIGLILIMFVTSIASGTYLARFGSATIAEVRADLCLRYLKLDYEKLLEIGKHQVTGSLVADVGRLATLFTVLPLFFFNGMMVLFSFGYLGIISWQLFLIFAAFMAFAIGSSLYLMGKGARAMAAIRDEEDELFEHFAAIANGKKELLLNPARADHFSGVVGESIERNRKLGYALQKWWNHGGTWSSTMIFTALFTVVLLGTSWLDVPPVTLMQFVIVVLYLMNPLNYVIVASQDIAQGFASARKMSSLGLTAPVTTSPAAAKPAQWQQITASGLRYRYNASDAHGFAFGPVDLTVNRGEILFVIGGNGSGKSTLALLLTALIKPDGGHLAVDGEPVGDVPGYRQLFSTVFFDFHLFGHVVDRTGKPAPDKTLTTLLRKMDLQDKVSSSGGKLSTMDLSQGQRKRLALVQAYVDDGEIFLFDEWAADQDAEFRRYFYLELLPELRARGKTVIAVTHDEKYFGQADRLVKLEQGQISPAGAQDHGGTTPCTPSTTPSNSTNETVSPSSAT
ncbi:cyclic peptide export ABC transporter [Kibdelosporangium philippinense]|uniref:Cyclic peptide export ABC transporter n=1 Tax=Kibdelosporangium philippinense TaxID=211113 RepID=A0ABS8ZNG0_9PSEU|nr:cyclic peptide export ABC transporter [Kibdelosporangium philippinense]